MQALRACCWLLLSPTPGSALLAQLPSCPFPHSVRHPIPQVARLTGNPLSYFLASGWRAADFASTCLLVACVSMWWALVWREALPFAVAPRFDVYADLGADAAYLSLADGGAGLQAMHSAFSRLQVGVDGGAVSGVGQALLQLGCRCCCARVCRHRGAYLHLPRLPRSRCPTSWAGTPR